MIFNSNEHTSVEPLRYFSAESRIGPSVESRGPEADVFIGSPIDPFRKAPGPALPLRLPIALASALCTPPNDLKK